MRAEKKLESKAYKIQFRMQLWNKCRQNEIKPNIANSKWHRNPQVGNNKMSQEGLSKSGAVGTAFGQVDYPDTVLS